MSVDDRPLLVLVHGAFHGAWCWGPLRAELAVRRLDSVAVELHRTSAADDVAAVQLEVDLAARRGPVVVVGHSMGGYAISRLDPDSVDRLVYLAAVVPGDGAPPPGEAVLPAFFEAVELGDDDMVVRDQGASSIFYHDCDPAVAADAAALLRRQRRHDDLAESTSPAWRSAPSTYVVCREDRVVSVDYQRRCAALLGSSIELDGGHSPMLARPAALADSLATLVQRPPAEKC